MTESLPRPTSGDVVDLILDDHRLFEELLRTVRDNTADQQAALEHMTCLLVAHEVAEETKVYGALRREDAITKHESEHGKKEHAAADEALLDVLAEPEVGSHDFTEALEEFAKALHHHLGEEETDILNPARTDVDAATRAELGAAFCAVRTEYLDKSFADARAIVEERVAKAKAEGKLDD